MDEAYCLTTGSIIGVTSAVLLLIGEKIPDIRDFRCPEQSCQAKAVLKAVRSKKRSPHFAAVGHQIDCEYASNSAGTRVGGTELALSGDFELAPGSSSNVGAAGSHQSTGTVTPTTEWKTVDPRLTLRAFVNFMQAWSLKDFAVLQVTILGQPRRTSHLFLRASWLARFDVGFSSIRWPQWMGPAKYPDASKHVHIVFGEATLGTGSEFPPLIRWQTNDSAGLAVRMHSDPDLFERSKFRRRFRRDLASVGWSSENSVSCMAVVLCTARPGAAGEIALYPAGSYEDVLLLPSGSTELAMLDAALAGFENRFMVHRAETRHAGSKEPPVAVRSNEILSLSDIHPSVRELFKRPDPVQHLPKEQNALNQQTAVAQPSPSNADTAETPPRGPIAAIRRLLRAVGRTFNR